MNEETTPGALGSNAGLGLFLPQGRWVIDNSAKQIFAHTGNTVRSAAEAGALLCNAKASLKHGQWRGWVAENCPFSERTAALYMKVHKLHASLDPACAANIEGRPLRDVLREVRKSPNASYADNTAA